MTTASELIDLLEQQADETQRLNLMRFFKTQKGQYGEGDQFLGLKVPQTREIVKAARGDIPLSEIEKLLYSKWHEARLCGFLLLVEEMKKSLPKKTTNPAERRDEIAGFYLRHAEQANNWDLVDLSCRDIIGEWILHSEGNERILDTLADSDNLWKQRIAVVATWPLIKQRRFDEIFHISTKLLEHPHDLIHKAIGWMLREVGKVDSDSLRHYLATYYEKIPRTSLRYAIERFSASERQYWLKRK
ncbi:MAG: DNA alkylation repair protein [Muribaculaceae bacterium]|nr:DNA alkylation repair protein [Muribaculaceae bacterium]